MDIFKFEQYINSVSLKGIANEYIDNIFNLLQDDSALDNFVLGYHIRHYLDTNAPTYVARIKDISKKERLNSIVEENKKSGRHTINHLIDTLYYKGVKKYPKDTCIQLFISFNGPPIEERLNHQNFEFHFASSSFDLSNIHSVFSIAPALEKFVSQLEIDSNIVNFEALYNAIEQLHTFSEFGKYTQSIVLRPKKPTDYVIGISLIADKAINLDAIFKALKQQFDFLNLKKDFDNNPFSDFTTDPKNPLYLIAKYKSLRVHDNYQHQHISNSVVNTLAPDFDDNEVKKTITTFLKVASDFCDEKSEGKPLSYGFVLGNPGLLDFLKGKNVLPSITDKSTPYFLTLDGIKSNIHLFANHSQTAIIIPYVHDLEIDDECNLPFFSMPMEKFEQDIFNWDYGGLIPSEFRPYAYLSYRFPWIFSAVVGPYSQIRVFRNGSISAYRDGKGWKSANNFEEVIINLVKAGFEAIKLSEFLNFIRLFSPIYNPNSHGALLTYVDELPEICQGEYHKCFQELVTSEPKSLSGWLKNMLLFDDQNRLNYEVAKRLLQTCVLDGAIGFSGSNYKIDTFGMRLSFVPLEPGSEKVGGTKRKTALDFVSWCKEKGVKRYFAVAISSDGPIRVYYTDPSATNGATRTFTLFERIK